MAFTDITSEDRLIQKIFAEHLQNVLGWKASMFGARRHSGQAETKLCRKLWNVNL